MPINDYKPIIQAPYKQTNKRGGSKGFNLHQCYKALVGNEKRARRNYEITPKREELAPLLMMMMTW